MRRGTKVHIVIQVRQISLFIDNENRIMNHSSVPPFSMLNRTVQNFPGIIAIPNVDGPAVATFRQTRSQTGHQAI